MIETGIKQQDFEQLVLNQQIGWQLDTNAYEGPYSESGEFYQQQNIIPPAAKRLSFDIGEGDWLSAELYSRNPSAKLSDYLSVVTDPADANNKVLRLATPVHTDGVILRSKYPLPTNYRIRLKIGFAQYGNETEFNGYDNGNERSGPWRDYPSIGHNGFYWLSIFDRIPRPHNNIWMHHHRKFVIDSWDRDGFKRTVNVIALDGKSDTHTLFGKTFISYLDGKYQYVNNVPVDYYLPNQWYLLEFSRNQGLYSFSITGKFKNAGYTTISDSIDYKAHCVYHYNQTPAELADACVDTRSRTFLDKTEIYWPQDSAYPDYFMLGDPHINYYEGSVLIDDISLERL